MKIKSEEYTKQLTALDWFLENLPNRFKNALVQTCENEIEFARKMQREQIINAYSHGKIKGLNIGIPISGNDENKKNILASEYYELNYIHK